jgi:hypothetical protein
MVENIFLLLSMSLTFHDLVEVVVDETVDE